MCHFKTLKPCHLAYRNKNEKFAVILARAATSQQLKETECLLATATKNSRCFGESLVKGEGTRVKGGEAKRAYWKQTICWELEISTSRGGRRITLFSLISRTLLPLAGIWERSAPEELHYSKSAVAEPGSPCPVLSCPVPAAVTSAGQRAAPPRPRCGAGRAVSGRPLHGGRAGRRGREGARRRGCGRKGGCPLPRDGQAAGLRLTGPRRLFVLKGRYYNQQPDVMRPVTAAGTPPGAAKVKRTLAEAGRRTRRRQGRHFPEEGEAPRQRPSAPVRTPRYKPNPLLPRDGDRSALAAAGRGGRKRRSRPPAGRPRAGNEAEWSARPAAAPRDRCPAAAPRPPLPTSRAGCAAPPTLHTPGGGGARGRLEHRPFPQRAEVAYAEEAGSRGFRIHSCSALGVVCAR